MKILTVCLLASQIAGAAFPTLKIEDVSGSYADRRGNAFAKRAFYELDVVKVEHSQLEVLFNNIEKNLVIQDTNTTVALKMDFSFLNVFKSLSFSGAKAVSDSKRFSSELEELRLFIEPSEYVLSGIKLDSDLSEANVDAAEVGVLRGFITNGDIAVEEISLAANASRALSDILPEALKAADADLPLRALNARLMIKEKTFSGSALMDSWLNAWLYIGGGLKYDEKENMLYIELKKAKLGVFSVRSKLLDKVAGLALETVKVRGNTIIVDLDQVAAAGRGASI